jgi:membrane protein implicated in regulation of membrane protease activity
MYSRVTTAEAPARNPVARSLALAVLGVALVAAAIMGAAVFAVLAGLFVVGYLVSLAHAWWRLFRARQRSADSGQPHAAKGDYIEGEFKVVEAAVDAAPRGPGAAA